MQQNSRKDNTPVIFKKLEKVGEPFSTNILGNKVWEQRYRLYDPMAILNGYWYHIDGYFIDIEIKQNKEDMEEKNNAKNSNSEKIGKNLKPFDLEAAKQGKPVCTRDGRKARIICFDRIDSTGCNLTIVALIQVDETEVLQLYHDNGKCDAKADLDLMMLPEKKEGWVNVYDDTPIYDTKERAELCASTVKKHIATVKIEWEE